LSKEQEIGKTIQIATGTVLLLLVLFVLFLFKNIKERSTTNKALIEKNNEISIIAENLSLANHEITEQKFLLDRKNQAITDSLNYAKRIQTTILPSKSYLKKFLPEMFVFFRPKDIVSGDFYWFHENISEGGNKIVLVAADCTGHGVPGAFMSLIGATLLNKIVKDGAVFSPAEILTKLDEAIQKDLRQKDTGNVDGMDAAIVVIDTSEKTLTFSGAKSPLLYIQNGELHFVKGSKVSVGGDVAQHRYEELEIDLRSETVFYIYSDGFQDQFGGYTGKKFMSKHFRELLFDIHKEAPDVQLEHLKKTLFEFQGHEPQVDDILVIGCKIKL
jgi:serine phosphatase RsbU (regulator of sigma subunit)